MSSSSELQKQPSEQEFASQSNPPPVKEPHKPRKIVTTMYNLMMYPTAENPKPCSFHVDGGVVFTPEERKSFTRELNKKDGARVISSDFSTSWKNFDQNFQRAGMQFIKQKYTKGHTGAVYLNSHFTSGSSTLHMIVPVKGEIHEEDQNDDNVVPEEEKQIFEGLKTSNEGLKMQITQIGHKVDKQAMDIQNGIQVLKILQSRHEKAVEVLQEDGAAQSAPQTAPQATQNEEEMAGNMSENEHTIIFVLGGPGSGKGTQCKMIVHKYDEFCHLSVGDLLRLEQESGSEHGTMIKNCIKEAKLAPSDIVVDLILKAMKQSGKKMFLVDGFPRSEENRVAFSSVCPLKSKFVLYLSCSQEVMVERVLHRNQGREDDNIESIRKRLELYETSSLPVIEYYRSLGMLREINSALSAEEVFEEVTTFFN